MRTLVVFSHQYFEKSKVNKVLLEAIKNLPNVKIRNLDELYGSNLKAFDIKKEQEFLKEAQKIVFQFPLFWFSTPPMLKAYQDEIFTATLYSNKGDILANKEFHIAVSLGSEESKYSPSGRNEKSLKEYLLPLFGMAKYCKMQPKEVFVSDNSFKITDEEIAEFAKKYVEFLS